MLNKEDLYCRKCKKLFKNKGTLSTHLISKVHLKNTTNNNLKIKSTKTNTINSIINSDNNILESDNYKIENFDEKLLKVLKREGEKKTIRMKRMTDKCDAINSVLYELENNHIEYTENTNIIENKSQITKMNKAGDNLQKNKLTTSRSSFIKSTLKP